MSTQTDRTGAAGVSEQEQRGRLVKKPDAPRPFVVPFGRRGIVISTVLATFFAALGTVAVIVRLTGLGLVAGALERRRATLPAGAVSIGSAEA
jgi:hypothetical protein